MEKLLGVYYVFEENLVHSTDIDAELFGKPAVGFVLLAQLFFDYQSYVNVRPHSCFSNIIMTYNKKNMDDSNPCSKVLRLPNITKRTAHAISVGVLTYSS